MRRGIVIESDGAFFRKDGVGWDTLISNNDTIASAEVLLNSAKPAGDPLAGPAGTCYPLSDGRRFGPLA